MIISPARSTSREAWTLVVGLGVVMSVLFGFTLNAFSIFTLPIIDVFQCSHEQAARVATVFLVSMTLAMPAAGWLLDHVAPRPVMATGGLLAGLAYLAAAQSGDLDSFTLAIALCGIGVGASTYVPAFVLLSNWFPPSRQGLAFGILLAIVGAGGTFLPMGLNYLVEAMGLFAAMEKGAFIMLLICFPLLLWLVRMPDQLQVASDGESPVTVDRGVCAVLRMPQYWLWTAMFVLVMFSGLSVLMSLVPYLISVGYSAAQGAAAYGAIAAATIVGSLSFGAISTRRGAGWTLGFGIFLCSLGVVCLLLASHQTFGLIAVVMFVLAWGTTFNLVNQLSPTLLVEFAGRRGFGSLLGIGNLVSGLGAALGPMLYGYMVDRTGSHFLPVALCAVLMAFALLPLAMLRRAQRQVPPAVALEGPGS